MSEMLGNQYFLARNFELAVEQYEKSLIKTPDNLLIRKKMILCYIKIGNLDKALKNLLDVLSKNPEIIFSTNEEVDDCPCSEIIKDIDTNSNDDLTVEQKSVSLGILWLYCDVKKALETFKNISKESEYNFEISRIIKALNNIEKLD